MLGDNQAKTCLGPSISMNILLFSSEDFFLRQTPTNENRVTQGDEIGAYKTRLVLPLCPELKIDLTEVKVTTTITTTTTQAEERSQT